MVRGLNAPAGMVKLRLRGLDESVETPWAEVLGPGRLRVDNLPFFAYGVSLDDVVEAAPTEHAGVFDFVRVVHSSGNRTVRIAFLAFPATDVRASSILQELLALGCSYEGMNPRLVAVNIPPTVELALVARLLTDAALTWEYANPTHDELFGS
jgi:hypothetical protein